MEKCKRHDDGENINITGSGLKYGFRGKYDLHKTFYPLEDKVVHAEDVYLPIVPVRIFSDLKSNFTDEEFPFILDTTSDYSYIPKEIALKIGIDLRGCLKRIVRGSEGEMNVFFKVVQVKLGKIDLPLAITVMVATKKTPIDRLPCLGISGIIDNFIFSIGPRCTRIFQKADFVCCL